MPNGRHEPDCSTCAAWEKGERRQGNCSLHRFVMPAFSDHVICRDWRAHWNPETRNPFKSLEPGVLYRWQEYGRTGPRTIARFEELREFLMDRDMRLFENPEHGWVLYLDPWEDELFPAAGLSMEMKLDGDMVAFRIADVPITTTYTNRDSARTLRMEDRRETRRVAAPAEGHAPALLAWIERHHDIARARIEKAKNLADPKMLYKDKVLRLMVRVVGAPLKARYELLPHEGWPGHV